jgi:hypothetical protein
MMVPAKHKSPIEVTEGDNIFNVFKREQDRKAYLPIEVPMEG